jgi:ABC-type nitrate/sulfonate/bicarbonate transport system substrate-binding protein
MLEKHGVSRMLISFHDIIPGYVFGGLAFSDDFLRNNPDRVKAFLRGFMKSVRFIAEHEARARAHIPSHTSVDSSVAMTCALRQLTEDGREDQLLLEYQRDLMKEYGFLDQEVSLDSIIDYRYLPDAHWRQRIKFRKGDQP